MISVRFMRLYKGFPYEIEMEFGDLRTVQSLGPIISQVERFIDGVLRTSEEARKICEEDVLVRELVKPEARDREEARP